MNLPDGVVTFLFTDVEGSTRLWEEAPDSMMEALRLHDEAIESAVTAHNGVSVKPRGEGDSRFVVFRSASDAAAGTAEMQLRLAEVDWPTPGPLRVRASLHTGTAELEMGDYYGSAVNRAARLRAIAHGGQTVLSGSTYELIQDRLPSGVTVVDMGPHRLRDLIRPERVYQLNVDGLESSFPPLQSLDAVPNNLPIQLTEFVGRETDIETAQRTLQQARLLTILAPGGAGKTRLAIQVAAELASSNSDGVFFVDLSTIDSPDAIIQKVAESLGIALSTEDDLMSQLLAYLGGKQQLLVLDNFEHLVAGAGLVTEILRNAPDVKLIVTSRTKLNLSGETVQALSGLETTWATAEEAFQTSSVRLFDAAAKRADVSYSMTGDDLQPLAEILETVGGMPLGIELAAAWVDVLPVAEIANEIAKNLDFLESQTGDVPDRHRSIRAVFDYSWAMLSSDERRTFCALSVFRGGFTREGAEAVTGASIRNLANLTSKSLLVSDRESGRYTIHELLRQYAEAALHEDKTYLGQTMTAFTSFYADLTSHAGGLIPSDEFGALQTVNDDLDNIRSAWRHALVRRDGASAQKFVTGLWFLYEIRGWHQAAVALFDEAFESFPEQPGDDAGEIARSLAAAAQGWFLSHLGQAALGAEQAGRSIEILKGHDDVVAVLKAIQCRCAALTYLNLWEECRALTTEGIAIATEAGDEWRAAELKPWLAFAELSLGDVDGAAGTFNDAEEVYSRFGEYRARSWNLMGTGMIALMQDRHREAIDVLEEMVRLTKEIGYRRAIQGGLQYLGDAHVAAGDPEAAGENFLEGLAMAQEMGQVLEMAGMLIRVAQVRVATGKVEEAVTILASVAGDPASGRSLIAESTPVSELARGVLTELGTQLDPKRFSAAQASGTAKTVEIMAKEILAATPGAG